MLYISVCQFASVSSAAYQPLQVTAVVIVLSMAIHVAPLSTDTTMEASSANSYPLEQPP